MEKETALDGMHPWFNHKRECYDCTVCNAFGNPPVQAQGAWVTRPINNWVKATALLSRHEKSEWHLAGVKKGTSPFFSWAQRCSRANVFCQWRGKKANCELMKKLIQSLYFLVKHHIPHTTIFEDLVILQIENGDVKLQSHRKNCLKKCYIWIIFNCSWIVIMYQQDSKAQASW